MCCSLVAMHAWSSWLREGYKTDSEDREVEFNWQMMVEKQENRN